jgi:hypothetical protein
MIQLSLIKCNEGYKLVHVGNRCRIVWICGEYACYLYGSFLFSGFNRFVHLCQSMLRAARQNIIWIRFGNRRAVRRWQTGAKMALTAIGGISQWGVVGCGSSRTDVLFQLKIRAASEKLKNQPRPLLRPRSVHFRQHFWNLSHETVPLISYKSSCQTHRSRTCEWGAAIGFPGIHVLMLVQCVR